MGSDRDVEYVDIGLAPGDTHTAYTENPSEVALNAFLDFFSLIDAKAVVRTGSSFSGTTCQMRGLQSRTLLRTETVRLFLCGPKDC